LQKGHHRSKFEWDSWNTKERINPIFVFFITNWLEKIQSIVVEVDMKTPAFERIKLGSSDLLISPLGIGTNVWGFRRRADPEKKATLEAALSGGINFIDTAEIYNLGGSEKTLGILLADTQEDVVLASKFFPYPWRLRKGNLKTALQASLRRLKRTSLDLYILHTPTSQIPLPTWAEALAKVQLEGLARHVGISNCSAAQTRTVQSAMADLGVHLSSNQVEYSLLTRTPERNGLIDTCRELGITLVAYRPLGFGLLTGKYKPSDLPLNLRHRLIKPSDLRRATPLINLMGEIGQRYGKSLAQVALNWVICKGAVPIPGAKNPRQAAENAGALGWRLEAEEVDALDHASDGLS
jgi:aryl-alcohol dehydrogenase-like predicted oxidoreductase